MNDPGSPARRTVTAQARYHPLPGAQQLAVGLALTTRDVPGGEDIQPHATAQFAVRDTIPVNLTAFAGEPPPRWWAGVEVHSRHSRIQTPTLDVLAVAESALEVPRYMCRALPGLEDWADEAPEGSLWGYSPGHPSEDICVAGGINGWWIHPQNPSAGTFELTAPVVRYRADPTAQDPEQLGVVTIRITISSS